MKVLVQFALKRRFLNKATLLLNILTFLVMGIVFFADKAVMWMDKDFLEPFPIYLSESLYEDVDSFIQNEEYYRYHPYDHSEMKPDGMYVNQKEDIWYVDSLYPLDMIKTQLIQGIIQSYEQNKWIQQTDNEISSMLTADIVYQVQEQQELSSDKQSLSMLLVSGLYFTALSLCTAIASEVIYEKTSRMIDSILVCVSTRTHFYSKVLTGWFTIVLQNLMTLSITIFWFVVRSQIDDGYGLLYLFKKMGLLSMPHSTFSELTEWVLKDSTLLYTLFLTFIFLLSGILLIQLIMAILSSYVRNIEEAGNIQAICYFLLMLLYYGALTLNHPHSMSVGIGKWLSFVPIFSMLFMPCRLLLQVSSVWEVLLSLVFALLTIVVVVDFGIIFYERGILSQRKRKT